MSRCFPFPPPGYEREHKLEDLALLKEVKLKEKKHKKDKERKKDKEKKERDGSDEKQRDKKDRKRKHKDKKEKHRDKRNDKEDRVKDRDKSSISEESTVAAKFEERSEEKLQLKGHGKDNSVADKGKTSTFFQGQNGGKTQSIISQAINDAKFAPELDRWIRHDEKGGGSLFHGRAASVDKSNSDAAPGTALRNSARVLGEDKSNDRDKRVHIKKMEPQGLGGQFTSKAMVENLVKMGNSKSEGPPKPMEEQNDRRLDIKENFNKTGDDERGRKQKERDKKSKEKDKEKKEKKRKEKREEKAKLKIEHEKSTSNCTNDHIVAASNKSTKLLKDDSAALTEENGRKRKDTDTNGFLHESEIRPNKVQGFALRQSTDNGNKLEAFHVPSKSSSGNHPIANNARLHHLDRLINGVNEAQRPSASKPISFVTNIVNDQMVVDLKTTRPDSGNVNEALRVPKMKDPIAEEVPRKPPHPDSKYLPQVLTVPKVDDWSGDDDLEWLFSKKVPPKRPHPESHVKEAPCVWSETVHIEPADVYALPYVIPY